MRGSALIYSTTRGGVRFFNGADVGRRAAAPDEADFQTEEKTSNRLATVRKANLGYD